MVAWTSRSDIWNDNGASHVPRHVLRQAPRTAVKDNQGRRQHALPRRHGHDRTTSWPDSPRGSLTAPLAASGVLPIWPLPLWAFGISRCQSACSSPTAHGSSCTCVAESIIHATYYRPESVPGPHSVRQSVREKNGPKVQVATCTAPDLGCPARLRDRRGAVDRQIWTLQAPSWTKRAYGRPRSTTATPRQLGFHSLFCLRSVPALVEEEVEY